MSRENSNSKFRRMPKKPCETSWNSDEDEDLLSDQASQEDIGAGGDVEIDENILEMSDGEIELMPPEVASTSLSHGAGDVLFDHSYVTETVLDADKTGETMIDETGDYRVVYTDGDTSVEGEEVTIETAYDEDESGISSTDQYVVVDEDGNVLQILQHVEAQSTEGIETSRDLDADTTDSVDVTGSAIAMETNTEQDACIAVMEEDESTFEPVYGSDDEEGEEKRRSDRFTSERNDDVISANAPTKRHIPDDLSISNEDRKKIQCYMEPRRSGNRNDSRRPQLASMNYLGAPVRPAQQTQRGRKILINPHFKPRLDGVTRHVVPTIAWDNTRHPVQHQRQAMVQRAWQFGPQQVPNMVHHSVQMQQARQQAMMHQPRSLMNQPRPLMHQPRPMVNQPRAIVQPHMMPHPMAPRPQMHPQHMTQRFQQQVVGPPLGSPYQPQFPQPGLPGRPLMVSRYRQPGPQQMMGPPISAQPPSLNFQGPSLQQQQPLQRPPHFRPMSASPVSRPRFQAPPDRMPRPRGQFVVRQHRPGSATGQAVMVRPSSADISRTNGQPRFIMRHRSPQQITQTVQTIQTIVGGSASGNVVHRTFKRVSTVVTAAPPAKLIKLDTTPAATESDYHRKLKEQAALRARIQEQKELRRQQMAGQRFQEAENTLAQKGLSIETVMNQQSQAIKIASTNRQNGATRAGFQTPAGHVAGPGLVSGHRYVHPRLQQPRVPVVGDQIRSVTAEGDHLGPRLVQHVSRGGISVIAVQQVAPVQARRTVLTPGGGGQVTTTGVVHVGNMAPHTTRERIVALAGSVGPTKCVAFVNTGRARVEFVHPGDAVRFYSRFNRKSLDSFVLQMTLS